MRKKTEATRQRIIDAARACGAQAIHPGYGFLSESAEFAEQVTKKGIVFVGPSAETLRQLGNKDSARKLAESLGIPVIPGRNTFAV